jgi:tetratricopeptide (TPR) repeat protein
MCEWESSHAPSPQWGGLFSHCRELAGTSDSAVDSGERDQPIGHLAELAVPVIAGSLMELGDGASPLSAWAPLAVSASFDEIPKRLAAGDALHRAMWHETRKELREAQHFYRVALENAPRDAGVLYSCGNDCFRRGDLERAASLFRRAIELMPASAILLNSLGSTLAELGRRDEAMPYFERALKVDPLYAPTYYNLVIGLYPREAYRDIVRLLEQRVKDEPDFSEGGEWLIRIRETLSQLQTPVPGASRHAPQ